MDRDAAGVGVCRCGSIKGSLDRSDKAFRRILARTRQSGGRHFAGLQLLNDFFPNLGMLAGFFRLGLFERQPACLKAVVVAAYAIAVDQRGLATNASDQQEAVYESALRILDDCENATSRIGQGQTAPKGLIRVTVPPTFARLHVVSKLLAFFAAYPDMAVEMAASESPTTIIEDGFDLAIHSGDLPNSAPVARRFAQTMNVLFATLSTSHDMVLRNRWTISTVASCGVRRAGLHTAMDLWLRARRKARYRHRSLSNQRY
jgi:hypothetical protein